MQAPRVDQARRLPGARDVGVVARVVAAVLGKGAALEGEQVEQLVAAVEVGTIRQQGEADVVQLHLGREGQLPLALLLRAECLPVSSLSSFSLTPGARPYVGLRATSKLGTLWPFPHARASVRLHRRKGVPANGFSRTNLNRGCKSVQGFRESRTVFVLFAVFGIT